jgi:hypothetical protein
MDEGAPESGGVIVKIMAVGEGSITHQLFPLEVISKQFKGQFHCFLLCATPFEAIGCDEFQASSF